MKRYLTLLATGMLVVSFGCGKATPTDPRDRPGFIDTSDPSKVPGTMGPMPGKGGKDTTSLKGVPKGPGAKP